jgi:hypothetical protein
MVGGASSLHLDHYSGTFDLIVTLIDNVLHASMIRIIKRREYGRLPSASSATSQSLPL